MEKVSVGQDNARTETSPIKDPRGRPPQTASLVTKAPVRAI